MMPVRRLIAALVVAFAAAGVAAAAPLDTPFRGARVDAGWTEAVVVVSDLDRSIAYFGAVAGWQVRARASTPRALLDFWGLPAKAAGREVLLCNPGDDYGCVRLVRLTGVAQTQIRDSALPWETGGVFSLMTRSRDIQGAYRRAVALGFGGFSPPTGFDYQGVALSNVVLRGPDGVNVAIYQRDRPALTGWATIRRLSSPFNAMQMVRDRDAARDFYTGVFGYGVLANADFFDASAGVNNFAVPQNLVTTLPRRHAILGIDVNGLADAGGEPAGGDDAVRRSEGARPGGRRPHPQPRHRGPALSHAHPGRLCGPRPGGGLCGARSGHGDRARLGRRAHRRHHQPGRGGQRADRAGGPVGRNQEEQR